MFKQINFWIGLFLGAVLSFLISSTNSEKTSESYTINSVPKEIEKNNENEKKITPIKKTIIIEKSDQSLSVVDVDKLQEVELKLAAYHAILEENDLLPKSSEEIQKAMEVLKSKITLAMENKEGVDLLDALKEMQKLGPAAYDETLKFMNLIIDDTQKYGIKSRMDFYRVLDKDLVLYALEDRGTASDTFREYAARIAFYKVDEKDAPKIFAGIMDNEFNTEADRAVAKRLINTLGRYSSQEVANTLEQQLEKFSNSPELLLPLVSSLGEMGFESSEPVLLSLKEQTTDEALLSKINLSIRTIAPPVSGMMLLDLTSSGQAQKAGLKAGDIITSYNGTNITAESNMRDLYKKAGDAELVPVEVMDSNNESRIVYMKPGVIGFTPKGVTQR